jgi:type III secretion system FlhB-like substrate exporter
MTPRNATRIAVGLADDAYGDRAPAVTVSACGDGADEVVKTAIRYGVPVIYDGPLARALDRVEVDAEIPAELFAPVALILARLEREGFLRRRTGDCRKG